jgi:OFA family oxalate/formate antiporter-like MFS transporter
MEIIMKEKYNFSARHWSMIGICFLLCLLANAVTSDSENVILPLLSDANGWDYYGKVLTFATIAGCTSIVGNLILGKICEKKGAKFMTVLSLFAAAIFVFLYGTATTYPLLVIGLIGTICFGQSISFLGANAIIASWFPYKKGLAMGFVTIGPPAATVMMVSALTFLINHVGIKGGIYTICGVLIAVAVLCIIFVHNTPEEVGCTPDNLNKQEIEALERGKNALISADSKEHKMTVKELVRTRAFWFIVIIIGICSLTQTGLMAQWIVRYQGTAFESKAGLLMSIAAVVGIFGSMIAGYLENKLGTQKAYAVLAIWFAVALVMNFTNIPILVYISVPMFGLTITFMQIFMPAFELSVFGRANFAQANAIIFPVVSICGQLTFLLISACKSIFGEVRSVYIVFAILLLITAVLALMMPISAKKQSR